MNIYANGFKLHVNENARIIFVDGIDPAEMKVVGTVVMAYEAFKALHESMGNIIEQHNAKLENVKKSN
jgi:hypothetical protein